MRSTAAVKHRNAVTANGRSAEVMTIQPTRRTVLRVAGVGAASIVTVLAGCSTTQRTPEPTSTSSTPPTPAGARRVLVAFFSRAGENYYYGGRRNLTVGNTEVVAGMIRDRTGADLYKIEPVDRYPDSYDEAVARNRDEQEADARPAITGALPDIGPYDVVILGSPVWGSRAPRIMSTFIERVDLGGKTVLPLVTYAVSGMSGIDDFYRSTLTTATVEDGLAVQGEEVQDAGDALDTWLRGHALIS